MRAGYVVTRYSRYFSRNNRVYQRCKLYTTWLCTDKPFYKAITTTIIF